MSVLRGHSVSSSRPTTSQDFYTRFYPLHYFLILIHEKEPVFCYNKDYLILRPTGIFDKFWCHNWPIMTQILNQHAMPSLKLHLLLKVCHPAIHLPIFSFSRTFRACLSACMARHRDSSLLILDINRDFSLSSLVFCNRETKSVSSLLGFRRHDSTFIVLVQPHALSYIETNGKTWIQQNQFFYFLTFWR